MDHLCGALIVASRIRTTGTLHDVTLPKSWISRLSPTIEALRKRDIQLVKIYRAQIIQLLEPIYTGQDLGSSEPRLVLHKLISSWVSQGTFSSKAVIYQVTAIVTGICFSRECEHNHPTRNMSLRRIDDSLSCRNLCLCRSLWRIFIAVLTLRPRGVQLPDI